MASTYGILTVTILNNTINYDLTAWKNNAGTVRLYSDDFIEAKITLAEEFIFGYIHQTYTSATVPVNVNWAIKEVAKLYMTNQLIQDKQIEGNFVNVAEYFQDNIAFMIENEANDGALYDVDTVDDYSYG